jgi:non-ribosomal peptide synthetase component E (peptide arylation enzyme)
MAALPAQGIVAFHIGKGLAEGRIAKWWMPDEVRFVDEIPLGATGKIDKKLLRERYAKMCAQ